MRLRFPRTSNDAFFRVPQEPGWQELEPKLIRSEQLGIKPFLAEAHTKPLSEIQDALIEKTKESISFQLLQIQTHISADQWVKEFFEQKPGLLKRLGSFLMSPFASKDRK